MTDALTIARGLTKSQRAAIHICSNSGNEIVQGGLDDSGIDTRVIKSLRRKDLLQWVAPPSLHQFAIWKLNELGLAVRNHLKATGGETQGE